MDYRACGVETVCLILPNASSESPEVAALVHCVDLSSYADSSTGRGAARGVQADESAYDREVGIMEHLRNDRDPKWTDSCLLKTSCWRIRQQSLSPPCRGSIWTESKPKFLSFSTMGEITPTTSLYLLWKYQWVGEPDAVFKIHNIREYPSQFSHGAMNE